MFSLHSRDITCIEKYDILNLKWYNLDKNQIAAIYGKALKYEQSSEVARVKLIDTCSGTCSEGLNISLGAADAGLAIATVMCGLLSGGVITGIVCGIGAIFSYGVAVDAAINTFDSCMGGCSN